MEGMCSMHLFTQPLMLIKYFINIEYIYISSKCECVIFIRPYSRDLCLFLMWAEGMRILSCNKKALEKTHHSLDV